MSVPSTRRRASEHPETQARWGSVWIEADKRLPFKIDSVPELPRRRRWWPFGRNW